MPASSVIRAFVAICVDTHLKAAIQDMQDQLQVRVGLNAIRWVRPEQLHLTLKFYGNVPVEKVSALEGALRFSCAAFPPFRLSLSGLGCFPSAQKPSVIWLGLSGNRATLQHLQKKIDEQTKAFGNRREDREFQPHLTMGRVKTGAREARQIGQVIQDHRVAELGYWEVRDIELIQSTLSPQGSAYRSQAVFPLSPYSY